MMAQVSDTATAFSRIAVTRLDEIVYACMLLLQYNRINMTIQA
jgi:hypothetical protein